MELRPVSGGTLYGQAEGMPGAAGCALSEPAPPPRKSAGPPAPPSLQPSPHFAPSLSPPVPAQSPATPGPKLLDQVREAIRTRHYSRRTEESYVAWIRRFILFHGKRHPSEMGRSEISRFLSSLAVEAKVSASTQNQALSALLFLYRDVLRRDVGELEDVVRAKSPRRLPVVLSRDEVRQVLDEMRGTPRLMATIMYGAGLRLLECARLRVKDVDFACNQIIVRQGKGGKDRVTILPATVRPTLSRCLETVRQQHEQDLGKGAGWVELPAALARKYPNAGREWVWQWIFPATRIYTDRMTGEHRRHHLHESVVQRAVRNAVLRLGIPKPATCHTFRHSFATHLLQGVAFLPCHLERTEAPSSRLSGAA